MDLLDLHPLQRHGLRMKIIRCAQCSCKIGTHTVSENVGSKGGIGLAQACLCHRLLLQQLPPLNCNSALSRSAPWAPYSVWGFLQASAAPRIVLNGGGGNAVGHPAFHHGLAVHLLPGGG